MRFLKHLLVTDITDTAMRGSTTMASNTLIIEEEAIATITLNRLIRLAVENLVCFRRKDRVAFRTLQGFERFTSML